MSLFARRTIPPPPPSATTATPPQPEQRRVHFEPAAEEFATPLPAAKKARQSNPISKRPRDLVIEDVAQHNELVRPSTEPVGALLGDEQQSESASNVFTLDTYPQMQRYLVDAITRSADLTQTGSEASAQAARRALMHADQRQTGVTAAAYTNYMLRVVASERARTTNANGVALLQEPPYSDAIVSAFASNFVGSAIECAPSANAHEHTPSDELRAASKGVTYEYMTTFMRTAHPSEYPCASREECVGMKLLGPHNEKLPQSVWKVFWFPDELPAVRHDPQKFAAEAKCRFCIGCKIYKANKCFINVISRNNRTLPDTLAADFHVCSDVPGEFPAVALMGHGVDGFYGLAQPIPRFSFVGWTAEPDGQRANCFIYKWDIPRFPIDRAWYERNLQQQGF